MGFSYVCDKTPQASFQVLFISFSISLGKKILNQSLPITSDFLYPVVFSAPLLNIRIICLWSRPTITALLVSIIFSENFFSEIRAISACFLSLMSVAISILTSLPSIHGIT